MGNPMMLVVGGIAGVLGAAIWAAIAYFFNYEIGWVAWGIGGLVGAGVAMGGGKGNGAAILACIITVLSICGGKIASVHFSLEKYISGGDLAADITMVEYNQAKSEAAAFAALTSPDDYPLFMIKYEYTDALTPPEVTQEELNYFTSEFAAELKSFHENPPPFEQWKAEQVAFASAFLRTQVTFSEMLVSSMGLFDIIFFLLAIITAYQIVPKEERVAYSAE